MIRVIQLLFLALLLFFVLTEGIPYIRDRVEGITPAKVSGREIEGSSESATCVRLAHQVNAYVNQQVVAASEPPGDPGLWGDSLGRIENELSEAEQACSCPTQACDTARRALREISALTANVDRLFGGDGSVAGALARRQESINALLEQARVLAR
ncbi:MAG: hypothetical protein OEM05_04190 [Myxococcales bacterium]|nr:hypothetical protein [Myxococcales bacterium]MDH3405127.1 hypothetical protein [Acidobacteriota bacterium]